MEHIAALELQAGKQGSTAGALDLEVAMRLHRHRVFRFALASLRDEDAAETVTQDCFYKAHKAWPSFRGECSLETWLMQIAINLIRDQARSRRLQFWKRATVSVSPDEPGSEWPVAREKSPEKQAALRQQVDAVWSAAAQLPQGQRTVFLLRFVEDMDLLEIAAVTGMKEGTVKAHLFRALQKIRMRVGSKI